jgi:Na+/melibiose symporter-like transporter
MTEWREHQRSILRGALTLLAAAALLRWWVPATWFTPLIIVGAIASIALHVIYINVWSIFPLLVDVALLFAVFGMHLTVSSLRG